MMGCEVRCSVFHHLNLPPPNKLATRKALPAAIGSVPRRWMTQDKATIPMTCCAAPIVLQQLDYGL
jgi:hypothetical protein